MQSSRLVFWLILLIFLYQNCGQNDATIASPSNDNREVTSASIGETDLTRPIQLKLESLDVEMDLNDGRIVNAENPTWIGNCLESVKLEKIKSLLEQNGVCQKTHQYPPETFCAMVYTFPYVEVFIGNNDIRTRLGEANSACPSQSIFLCQNDSLLEPLIRTLNFAIDFSICL